jgi:hypothetical protein
MAAQYDLAGCYAFLGEKDSAYHYIEEFLVNLNYFGSRWHYWISYDPMFNKIRDERRFQDIVDEMRKKDQVEQQRVKMWLKDNNMVLYD